MTLFGWLRESNGKQSQVGNPGRRSQRVASTRPRLEALEDRVTPTPIPTVTNITISITPNFVSRMATETVTATVTQAGTTPTTTPVTSGTVAFNLNGKTGDVGLNSKGTATFVTSLPLYAVVANQTLGVEYSDPTNTFDSSAFLSPVYLNVLNAVLPSQITFGTPPTPTVPPTPQPFNSASGETNTVSLFSVPITFNYIDPGTIDTFTILGFTIPGSFSSTLFADAQSAIVSASNQLI